MQYLELPIHEFKNHICNLPMIWLEQNFLTHVNRKSKRVPEKHISALFTMSKPLTMWITINCGKFWNRNRKRDTDVQNRLLDSVGEGEGGMFQENSMETCLLSRVKQITSPDGMHERSAQAWCAGKTQRDRVEKEVRGEIRMGNTCKSMADSCMTKPITIL